MDPNEFICFRDQTFINTFPLNENNILDYFSGSQFYLNSCTNEVLKMQTKFANLSELQQKLDQMIGVQYILSFYNDDRTLFIIKEINRFGIHDFEVTNVFYCIHGNVYQCPTNISVFDSRQCNFYYHMNEAFDLLEESMNFELFKGVSYGEKEKKQVHEVERKEAREELNFFYGCMQDFYDNKE